MPLELTAKVRLPVVKLSTRRLQVEGLFVQKSVLIRRALELRNESDISASVSWKQLPLETLLFKRKNHACSEDAVGKDDRLKIVATPHQLVVPPRSLVTVDVECTGAAAAPAPLQGVLSCFVEGMLLPQSVLIGGQCNGLMMEYAVLTRRELLEAVLLLRRLQHCPSPRLPRSRPSETRSCRSLSPLEASRASDSVRALRLSSQSGSLRSQSNYSGSRAQSPSDSPLNSATSRGSKAEGPGKELRPDGEDGSRRFSPTLQALTLESREGVPRKSTRASGCRTGENLLSSQETRAALKAAGIGKWGNIGSAQASDESSVLSKAVLNDVDTQRSSFLYLLLCNDTPIAAQVRVTKEECVEGTGRLVPVDTPEELPPNSTALRTSQAPLSSTVKGVVANSRETSASLQHQRGQEILDFRSKVPPPTKLPHTDLQNPSVAPSTSRASRFSVSAEGERELSTDSGEMSLPFQLPLVKTAAEVLTEAAAPPLQPLVGLFERRPFASYKDFTSAKGKEALQTQDEQRRRKVLLSCAGGLATVFQQDVVSVEAFGAAVVSVEVLADLPGNYERLMQFRIQGVLQKAPTALGKSHGCGEGGLPASRTPVEVAVVLPLEATVKGPVLEFGTLQPGVRARNQLPPLLTSRLQLQLPQPVAMDPSSVERETSRRRQKEENASREAAANGQATFPSHRGTREVIPLKKQRRGLSSAGGKGSKGTSGPAITEGALPAPLHEACEESRKEPVTTCDALKKGSERNASSEGSQGLLESVVGSDVETSSLPASCCWLSSDSSFSVLNKSSCGVVVKWRLFNLTMLERVMELRAALEAAASRKSAAIQTLRAEAVRAAQTAREALGRVAAAPSPPPEASTQQATLAVGKGRSLKPQNNKAAEAPSPPAPEKEAMTAEKAAAAVEAAEKAAAAAAAVGVAFAESGWEALLEAREAEEGVSSKSQNDQQQSASIDQEQALLESCLLEATAQLSSLESWIVAAKTALRLFTFSHGEPRHEERPETDAPAAPELEASTSFVTESQTSNAGEPLEAPSGAADNGGSSISSEVLPATTSCGTDAAAVQKCLPEGRSNDSSQLHAVWLLTELEDAFRSPIAAAESPPLEADSLHRSLPCISPEEHLVPPHACAKFNLFWRSAVDIHEAQRFRAVGCSHVHNSTEGAQRRQPLPQIVFDAQLDVRTPRLRISSGEYSLTLPGAEDLDSAMTQFFEVSSAALENDEQLKTTRASAVAALNDSLFFSPTEAERAVRRELVVENPLCCAVHFTLRVEGEWFSLKEVETDPLPGQRTSASSSPPPAPNETSPLEAKARLVSCAQELPLILKATLFSCRDPMSSALPTCVSAPNSAAAAKAAPCY